MRRFPLRLLLVGLLAAVLACQDSQRGASFYPLVPADSVTWVSSAVVYDTTMEKKDLSIVFFLADWCGWCTKLKKEVLTDKTVVAILSASYNAVRINPDADSLVAYRDTLISCRAYVNQYAISGYPTAIVVNKAGEETSRWIGYRPAADYARLLDSLRRLP